MALKMNRRMINPPKAPTHKRDPSHLDWHYKIPTPEELEDPYPCFPTDMWSSFFQAAKEATSLPLKKKANLNLLRDQIKRDACDDCSVRYQTVMTRLDRCHPIEGAITPLDRKRAGMDYDEDH